MNESIESIYNEYRPLYRPIRRIARKEISLSFLGRAVSSLFLTAFWGPRAPQAWLLRGQSPRNFNVSSPV
jgi:hypothetical protein